MIKLSEKHSEIKKLIKERSPFNEDETNQILNDWFNSIPTLVKIVVENYQFNKKKVLDIGCAYGNSLLYWREDSEGIEIEDHMIKFLKALGRTTYKINVEDGFSELKKESYDAIYSAALIEHLVSPHLFLLRLNLLLKPGGILAIAYPLVPPSIFHNFWKTIIGYKGWAASTHINFFTARDSKLTIERAGFKVIRQHVPAFYRIPLLKKIDNIFLPIGVSCLSVCQKIDNFKFPKKRDSQFDPLWAPDLKNFR
jgi:SAM-dependent methyltransferase